MVGVIIEYDRNTDAEYFSPKSKEKRKKFQQNSSKIRRIFGGTKVMNIWLTETLLCQ